MIKNIIFDMGNVLIRFDPDYFIARLGIGNADKALMKREVYRSVEWAQLDRGSVSLDEAVKSVCARLPERLHPAAETLLSMRERPILPIEGMYELIEELHSGGYGIYLLSNAALSQHEYWPRVPAGRFFAGQLISADEKLVKPQPEIYRLLLERFSLHAEDCIFVDDSPVNVEAALCCGIAGIVFHGDTSLLRTRLREHGVNVNA